MLFSIIAQAAFPFTNTCVCQAEAVVVIVLVQSALGMTKTGGARTGGAGKKVSSSKQGNKEILVITNTCSPAAGFHPAPLKAEAAFVRLTCALRCRYYCRTSISTAPQLAQKLY